MAEIISMGELLCEIMRPDVDMPLGEPGLFRGPFPSGAPAIFIDTAARLGRSTKFIGGVGNDPFGKCILDRLSKDGVDISAVLISDEGSTGVAFVSYDKEGDRKFLFHFSNTPATLAKAPVDSSFYEGIRFFHIMGCSLMASDSFGKEILKAMDLASAAGAKISFDPNVRPELIKDSRCMERVGRVLEKCSIIEAGETELLTITGVDAIEKGIEQCFLNPILEILIIKKGSRGCSVHTREECFEFGIYETVVADPTGAGDSFDAAFLSSLIEGRGIKEATKIASAAASLNTAGFGPMEGKITREAISRITGISL